MKFALISGGGTADEALLFFNGWGMDPSVVKHLDSGGMDVWSCWDYGDGLDCPDFAPGLFASCSKVHVVAWSLGVWAADRFMEKFARFLPGGARVAVNGTVEGIDDRYGIPVKGYILTERGILRGGPEKFVARMFTSEADKERFLASGCSRDTEGRQRELVKIRELVEAQKAEDGGRPGFWTRAMVSSGDLIFPVENMKASWERYGAEWVTVDSGHCPFYGFYSWRELLCR